MNKKIIVSGFGGQGIMLSGEIICNAGMTEDKEVSFFPSYGAEMRGGTAHCQVIISDEPIGSPVVENPDYIVSMNKPSYLKFTPKATPGGKIIINSDLFTPENPDDKDILVPGNTIAEEIGTSLVMNTVMIGAFVSATNILDIKSVEKSITATLGTAKKKFWDINIKALYAGYNFL